MLDEAHTDPVVERLGMRRYHYGVVLALILTSLIFQLAAPDGDWARLVTIVIQGMALLAALAASRVHPWILRAAAAAVALAVLASAAAFIGPGGLGPTAARTVTTLMIALAPAAIVRGVIRDFQAHGVSLHTMFGVLCVYLLIGSLFAFLYGLIDSVGPSFFAQQAAGSARNFLYFSFVTITTVGYGDLTAGTNLGRSLAIAEALTGQIYMVTVVAGIVSGLGTRRA